MKRIPLAQIALLAALTLGACAPVRTAPPSAADPEAAEVVGPVIEEESVETLPVEPELYGPVVGEAITTEESVATDTAVATATATETESAPTREPPKLCLVLGPGMAKAMAQAAVLDAIRKAKIPVHCVVGAEMGAVVGALYSFLNGSTNSLQWQLFKLSKDSYLSFPMISLSEPRSTGKKLNDFFREIFKERRIEDLPIPFGTNAVEEARDASVSLLKGDLAGALSGSVAVAGIFEPWKIGGESYLSAVSADPAPVELARRLGGNFIVLVDVLQAGGAGGTKSRFHRAFTAARSLMRLQKKEADFVIQVDTSAIQFDDFGRKGELLAAGERAAEKEMPRLKAAWESRSAGN